MAGDGGKKEDQFGFTPEGEALGYISLDQARVLAMRTARESPGAYGRRFRHVPMAFEVIKDEETEDHYVVTLSFRPQGQFTGAPGQEQFFIEKEGAVAHRQVLGLPAPAGGRRFPVVPVAVGLMVAAIAAVVGVILASGGDGGGTPVPTIAPAPTPTQVPESPAPVPTPQSTAAAALEPKGTLTPAAAATGTSTPHPLPTDTPLPATIPAPTFKSATQPTLIPPTPTSTPSPTAASVATPGPAPTMGPPSVARLLSQPWKPSRLTGNVEDQRPNRGLGDETGHVQSLLSSAQEDAWLETISWLTTSPDGSATYAGTVSGIYKSSDGGLTWLLTQLPKNANRFVPIRFDPQDRQVMYGSADVQLWRSVDGGESSLFLGSPLGNPQSLAVSSDSVYLTSLGALFRSLDQGDTWRQTATGGAGGADRLFVVPGHASVLYWVAGISRVSGQQSSTGLFISKDGGFSWAPVLWERPPEVLGSYGVADITLSSEDPPILYANLGNQIWKTDALDPREWSVVGAADVTGGGEMALQPGNSNVMAIFTPYVQSGASGRGLNASFDGGKSWVPLHEAGYQIGNVIYQGLPPGAHSLVVTGGSPWTICIASDAGVWCHWGVRAPDD